MKFWLYMITVILSLPKSIVFVILGTPSSENSKAAKFAKVIAIGVVVIITRRLSPSFNNLLLFGTLLTMFT
jgi:hypothetical protein